MFFVKNSDYCSDKAVAKGTSCRAILLSLSTEQLTGFLPL